mgnify:CR=1 FL=1
MEDMGMTDKQFNGFLRLVIDQMSEIQEMLDKETLKDKEILKKYKKLLDGLQKTLED